VAAVEQLDEVLPQGLVLAGCGGFFRCHESAPPSIIRIDAASRQR
jgi:hypothetical protein